MENALTRTLQPPQSGETFEDASADRAKMNRTTVNTTLQSCGLAIIPLNPTNISRDLYGVFILIIAVNALTCPLVILLNILVLVAVKTKQHLRTKSNVTLACLAVTDLVVGLVVQPLHATNLTLLVEGEGNTFCSLAKVAGTITFQCCVASLHHLLLISAERYIAIKHALQYETVVTEVRIIMASGLMWAITILVPQEDVMLTESHFAVRLTVSIMLPVLFIFLPMVYFNITIYKEVRRNERQIAANQVSPEAKKKILKNKKAFYTTVIVLLVIFLCYIPVNICFAIVAFLKNKISANTGHIVTYLFILLPVLNSLFNPLIYAVRIRHFRVAFIQLMSRKTLTQAEELELKIFAPNQIGVIPAAEQRQDRASREENEQQENDTLNTGHTQL